MSRHPLHEILRPNSIAVAGASEDGRGAGFVTPLQELGFKGKIYPVNPKYAGKEAQLIAFIRNPVKVDPAYPQMPNPGLKPNEADAIAKYLLETYDEKNK